MDVDPLCINVKPPLPGRTNCEVTAFVDDEKIWVDCGDLRKASFRKKFIDDLCARHKGVSREEALRRATQGRGGTGTDLIFIRQTAGACNSGRLRRSSPRRMSSESLRRSPT